MRTDLGEIIIIVLILGVAAFGYLYASNRTSAQDAVIASLCDQIAQITLNSTKEAEKTHQQLDQIDQQIAELHRILGVRVRR